MLRDFLEKLDDWNLTIVINNDDLVMIKKCKVQEMMFENTDENSVILNRNLVAFGFYNDELTVRVD